MVNEELDTRAWIGIATAISAALATGIVARDRPVWRALERLRRAIAFSDFARADALLLVLRRRFPEAYTHLTSHPGRTTGPGDRATLADEGQS
jgi:hypothetical protein